MVLEERARGVNLDGRRVGGMDLDRGCTRRRSGRAVGTSMAGARWRRTRRRSEAPAWRRSVRHRGGCRGGADASGCVVGNDRVRV
jgi:hypothetical protein